MDQGPLELALDGPVPLVPRVGLLLPRTGVGGEDDVVRAIDVAGDPVDHRRRHLLGEDLHTGVVTEVDVVHAGPQRHQGMADVDELVAGLLDPDRVGGQVLLESTKRVVVDVIASGHDWHVSATGRPVPFFRVFMGHTGPCGGAALGNQGTSERRPPPCLPGTGHRTDDEGRHDHWS